jgi:hypothetical protein
MSADEMKLIPEQRLSSGAWKYKKPAIGLLDGCEETILDQDPERYEGPVARIDVHLCDKRAFLISLSICRQLSRLVE